VITRGSVCAQYAEHPLSNDKARMLNRLVSGQTALVPPAGLEPAHPVPETGCPKRPLNLTKPQVRDSRTLSKAKPIRLPFSASRNEDVDGVRPARSVPIWAGWDDYSGGTQEGQVVSPRGYPASQHPLRHDGGWC